jgi:hypothetical protein
MRLNLLRTRVKFRINNFRITVYFFPTDTCVGIVKVRELGNFARIASFRIKAVPLTWFYFIRPNRSLG